MVVSRPSYLYRNLLLSLHDSLTLFTKLSAHTRPPTQQRRIHPGRTQYPEQAISELAGDVQSWRNWQEYRYSSGSRVLANVQPINNWKDSLNDEFARNLGVKKRPLNEINDEPLPNPWVSGKNLEDRGMNGISRRLHTLKDEMDPLIGYDDPGLIFMKPTDDNMHAPGTPNSFLGNLNWPRYGTSPTHKHSLRACIPQRRNAPG